MSGQAQAGDSITRSAAFAIASQLSAAALTAVLTVYLVRALGPGDYGVFALAVGFASLALLPADFGVSGSAARFIAERRGDPGATAAVLAQALRVKLVLTSAFALVLIASAGPIASLYDNPDLAWPLRGVAIALVGQSVMLLFMNAFVALRRVSIQFRLVLCESAVEVTASIALVLLAGGATAASFGRAVGFLFGGLLGVALAIRLLGRGALLERQGGPGMRRLASYAGALLIVDGAYALFSQLDILLVGAIAGTSAAGLYGAPLKLTALLHYPGLALANAIAPRLARGEGDAAPDAQALATGLRYLIVLQAAIVVPLVVWADPIVELVLGPDYGASADVLRALAPYVFLQGLGPLVTVSLNYLGEARRRVPIVIFSVLVNLGLLVALIPPFDLVGAAVSVDVAYAIYAGAHLYLCRRLLGVPLRPVLLATIRSLLAAAAAAGVLFAFGTADLGALEWILGSFAGVAAFGAVLVLTRELSPAQIRAAPGAVARRLRGTRAG